MDNSLVLFQLGKNGLSEGFIEALSKTFKNHGLIKLSILKACTRDREEIKNIAENIKSGLNEKAEENREFIVKIIGFTIIIKKIKKSNKRKK